MAEEQPTTGTAAVDTGAQEALPVEQTDKPAATEEQSQQETAQEGDKSSTGEQTSSLPDEDDKLKSFAKGQGIDDVSQLTQREKSLLKSAYDSQAEFSRKRAGAKLRESMDEQVDEYAEKQAAQTGQDPDVLKRLAATEVKLTVRDFFDANPDARDYEQTMVDELKTRPHLAGDLEALYAVARSKNPDLLKSAGGRKALETLASKQQAAAVNGSAINPAPPSKNNDPFLKGLNSDN